MTADDFLKVCLSLIGHTKDSNPIASDYFLGMLNVCLAECANIERTYCMMNAIDTAKSFNIVSDLSGEIPMSDYVLLNVVSKGVAARLAGEEDNQMLADYYGTIYEQARVRALGVMYADTENIAEGGEVID